MDQEPDPGHDKEHDAGERINEEGQIDHQIAAEDPGVGDDLTRDAGPQRGRKHRN